jgi:hypothetical protein
MRSLRLHLLCLLMLICAADALAQVPTIQRNFKGKPGSDINVGIFASVHKNCTPAALPAIRVVSPPGHGKVTVKQGHLRATNLPQCLAVDVPAFVAIYHSDKDYLGQDTFTLEVVNSGGKAQQQTVTVTLVAPGSQKGI